MVAVSCNPRDQTGPQKSSGLTLGGVLDVLALDDGVDRAGLLAEAAVDALGHVDVVAGRPAGAVGAHLRLDRDGLGGADGLAQLARDAPLLTRGVAPQGVLATEPGGHRALLCGGANEERVSRGPDTEHNRAKCNRIYRKGT